MKRAFALTAALLLTASFAHAAPEVGDKPRTSSCKVPTARRTR